MTAAAVHRSPAAPSRSALGQRPPAWPRAPVPTSPDPSAATSEGWRRDAVAPAACSPWVPARAHAGPGAHLQPCPWTPAKAQRTDPRVDSMDRGTFPQAVALLLAVCSLGPTSRCPGTRGGETRPPGHRPGPKCSGPPPCVPSSRPVELSWDVWTAQDRCHGVTNHPGLAGRRSFSPKSLRQTGMSYLP